MKAQSLVFVSIILIFFLPVAVFGACIEGDCENGTGTYEYHNGKKYVGEFKNSKKHGQGIYTYPDGSVYEGEFQNNKKHGQGVETTADGSKYEGEFKKGKRNGFGTITTAKGEVVSGEFKDDELVKPAPPPSAQAVVEKDEEGEGEEGVNHARTARPCFGNSPIFRSTLSRSLSTC